MGENRESEKKNQESEGWGRIGSLGGGEKKEGISRDVSERWKREGEGPSNSCID